MGLMPAFNIIRKNSNTHRTRASDKLPWVSSTTFPTVSMYFYDDDDRTKASTANYRKMKDAGLLLPVNAYGRTIARGSIAVKINADIRVYGSAGLTQWDTIEQTIPRSVPLPSAVLAMYPSQRNEAIQDAKAKLGQRASGVELQAQVELGEAGKSAQMVYDRVRDVGKFALDFKRSKTQLSRAFIKFLRGGSGKANRKQQMYEYAKELNSMYLEWTYGWKPLIGSVQTAAEIAADMMMGEQSRTKVTGKGEFVEETCTTISGSATLNTNVKYTYVLINTYKYECYAGGIFAVSRRSHDWNRKLGLHGSEIIPSLYELATFSFVIDYFSNLGDVIGNLRNSVAACQSNSLYLSQKVEYTTRLLEGSCSSALSNVVVTGDVNTPEREFYVMQFSRVPLSLADSYVSFTLKVPSWHQAMNVLSLSLGFTNSISSKMRIP